MNALHPNRCTRYRLSLEGEDMFVQKTRDAAVARLQPTPSGMVEIEVAKAFDTVVVRPLASEIRPEIYENKIRLTLPEEGYFCIEIDDDLEYPLLILVDKPPSLPSGDNVLFLGPGRHIGKQIIIRDGMCLYIDHDAWIEGGIVIDGLKNIKIIGTGIICGSDGADGVNASPLLIRNCENVDVSGVMLISRDIWSCVIRRCNAVRLERIKVVSSGTCSDGIDIDGSSNVSACNSFVKCNDDCLCIKSTPLAQGASVANVLFSDCVLWNGPSGNGIELGYESQCETFRDIVFRKIDILHVLEDVGGGWKDRQAALAIHITHDALVENVLYEDIVLEDVRTSKAIQFMTFHYYREHGWFSPCDRLAKGRIRNLHLKNVKYIKYREPRIHLEGFNSPDDIDKVTFENLTFSGIPAQDHQSLCFEKVNTANFEWR